jgi:hypothetical protein
MKSKIRLLLRSILLGIIIFFVIRFITSVLYDAFSSPVTTTYETKHSKGITKISEQSPQMRNAMSLTVGIMGSLLVTIIQNFHMTQKQRNRKLYGLM